MRQGDGGVGSCGSSSDLNLSSGVLESLQRGKSSVRPDPGQVFLLLSPLNCRQEGAATCLTQLLLLLSKPSRLQQALLTWDDGMAESGRPRSVASASRARAMHWEPGTLLSVHTISSLCILSLHPPSASSCCILPGHNSSSSERLLHPPAPELGQR